MYNPSQFKCSLVRYASHIDRILSQTLFLFFCSVPCHRFSISSSFSYYCRKRRNWAALIMCFRAELGSTRNHDNKAHNTENLCSSLLLVVHQAQVTWNHLPARCHQSHTHIPHWLLTHGCINRIYSSMSFIPEILLLILFSGILLFRRPFKSKTTSTKQVIKSWVRP